MICKKKKRSKKTKKTKATRALTPTCEFREGRVGGGVKEETQTPKKGKGLKDTEVGMGRSVKTNIIFSINTELIGGKERG